MTVGVPAEKQCHIKKLLVTTLTKRRFKIRDLAQLLGTLVSLCPATRYGWVYTKKLKRATFLTLKRGDGDYETWMFMSQKILDDLEWWYKNIDDAFCPIRQFNFRLTIFTVASPTGWGQYVRALELMDIGIQTNFRSTSTIWNY